MGRLQCKTAANSEYTLQLILRVRFREEHKAVNDTIRFAGILIILLAVLISPASGEKSTKGVNWPSFRGLNASGTAEGFPLPSEWDIASSRNILWNTAQVIVNGYKHIGGYDLKTGKELWRLQGGGDIPVPTPIVAHDMAFITNAHGKMAPIYAIRLTATGDISLKGDETSNQFVAWSAPRDGSYMTTPIAYGDYVYNCRWNGVLSCYEDKSGIRLYQERLGGGTSAFSSSAVAGDGKIFLPSEEGDIYVVKAGPRFEVLAKNSMDEICMASPAISGGVIYFRIQSHLVAVTAR
jgi:outer membrane protein assembly factor BamB